MAVNATVERSTSTHLDGDMAHINDATIRVTSVFESASGLSSTRFTSRVIELVTSQE
jgi:hypothetical protein